MEQTRQARLRGCSLSTTRLSACNSFIFLLRMNMASSSSSGGTDEVGSSEQGGLRTTGLGFLLGCGLVIVIKAVEYWKERKRIPVRQVAKGNEEGEENG
jgi:hypothetical protein